MRPLPRRQVANFAGVAALGEGLIAAGATVRFSEGGSWSWCFIACLCLVLLAGCANTNASLHLAADEAGE